MISRKNRQRIIHCLSVLCFIYVALAAKIFLTQRDMLYYPNNPDTSPLPAPRTVGLDMEAVSAQTEDGLALQAWFAPPKKKDGPVVVIFHGNANSIAYRGDMADAMMKKGHGVYMCEYRGFGGNPGSLSEEGLYKDARAGVKWLEGKGYKKEQLVYYGESLGTGVAIETALHAKPGLMVLQAPFTSIADVARPHFWYLPIDLLLQDEYDSMQKIGKYSVPVLFIHGEKDRMIPIRLARELYAAAREPKEFLAIPNGDHNDLYSFGVGEKIAEWIGKQSAKN